MPTLVLLVGLPGAGKTTRARQIADERRAVRLTPDDWMIPLFGPLQPPGRRDVLEGRLVWLATELLALGNDVVLDFGLWGRDERSALRALAAGCGAEAEVVYLPVTRQEQLDRISRRQERVPHTTFAMSEADVDAWRTQFEVPDEAELRGEAASAPPPGWTSWVDWSADRWPSSAG